MMNVKVVSAVVAGALILGTAAVLVAAAQGEQRGAPAPATVPGRPAAPPTTRSAYATRAQGVVLTGNTALTQTRVETAQEERGAIPTLGAREPGDATA